MQQFFLESPLLLAVSGLAFTLLAGFLWLQTAARMALLASAAIAVLTLVLVLISVQVETDDERIRRTIDEVAEALSANDVPRVISYIHPGATAGVTRAKAELPNYVFSQARMTRLKSLQVDRTAIPASAIAEFNVAVTIESQGQSVPVRRFVKVYFVEHDQRWLVRDYEHFEALAGLTAD